MLFRSRPGYFSFFTVKWINEGLTDGIIKPVRWDGLRRPGLLSFGENSKVIPFFDILFILFLLIKKTAVYIALFHRIQTVQVKEMTTDNPTSSSWPKNQFKRSNF